MANSRNLSSRLGGWSVRHRKTAIFGWLIMVVVLMAVGSVVGQQKMTTDEYAAGDSAKALAILDHAGLKPLAAENILVRSDTQTADAPAVRATVSELLKALQGTGRVTDLRDPYPIGLVSADRHSVLVMFSITGEAMTAADRVQPVLDAVARVRAAHPALRIEQFGEASGGKWFNDTIMKDFRRAEWTAVPLALGILLVAFGAFLAAVLPVLLALTAFFAATGLLAAVSHAVHLDSTAQSVMLLVGLAVGVDYCLFYLRREREERARGHDPDTALRVAAATSGRSVLVSGLTVVLAMSGMFLSGMLLFDGFALATIMVVLISMAGSVTVLPALLSLLGDRVEFGRIPGLGRLRRPQGGGRVWGAILGRVLARPALSAGAAIAFLLLLAAPLLTIHTEKLSLDKQLPADTSIIRTYHDITAAFPGGPSPARVIVQADQLGSARVQRAITDFTVAALATQLVELPIQVSQHPAQQVAEIDVPLAGNGSDRTSQRALTALREQAVPQTLGKVPGVRAYLAGDLAFSDDFNAQLRVSIAPVLLFVMAVAFLVMLFSFRSVTIAAVSIGLNLLSVGAAFGVIVAVFQHGWGAALIGTRSVGAIESWLPLFAFVILFGLSMDYHVFVVSRIREAHDRGMITRDAVSHGIRTTAGVVTSAAVIMVAVFAVFGTLSMQDFKQLGAGLGAAILLDATVVRGVLLPSVLSLLGERCWYLPGWLSFLPGATREDLDREGVGPQPVLATDGASAAAATTSPATATSPAAGGSDAAGIRAERGSTAEGEAGAEPPVSTPR